MQVRPAQVQRQRVFGIVDRPRFGHRAGRVAEREEPGAAAGLGLVGVDRASCRSCGRRDGRHDRCSRPATGRSSVSKTSNTSGACTPIVGCSALGGLQADSARRRRIRRACSVGVQRHATAVAGQHVALVDPARDLAPAPARPSCRRSAPCRRRPAPRPARARARARGAVRARCRAARPRRSAGSGTRSAARTSARSKRIAARAPDRRARPGNPARRSAAA